jgi:hypothetical protein
LAQTFYRLNFPVQAFPAFGMERCGAPEFTVDAARMAVKSRAFPLYESTDGENWQLSSMPKKRTNNLPSV